MVTPIVEIKVKEGDNLDESIPTLQTPLAPKVTQSDNDEGDGNKGKEYSPPQILEFSHEENKENKVEEEPRKIDEEEL